MAADEHGLSEGEIHVLKHTLGLDRSKKPYRNYFVAGGGHHEQPMIDALVERGLMRDAGRSGFIDYEHTVYQVTLAGKKLLGVQSDAK